MRRQAGEEEHKTTQSEGETVHGWEHKWGPVGEQSLPLWFHDELVNTTQRDVKLGEKNHVKEVRT